MLKLRTNLQNSEAEQLSDDTILKLCQEWKLLKSLENRSWFLLQIQSAINAQILDINLLISAFVSVITEFLDLILLGWILRLGANPNLYVQTPLGPSHIMVYAIIQGRKNKIPNDVLISMACMFVIVSESQDIPILQNPAYNTQLFNKNEKESYNSKLVSEVNTKLNPSIIISKTKVKESITIEKWLQENSIMSLQNISQVLFSLGKTVPAIIGTCLDNKELALLVENEIPSFEFVITCRAVDIIKDYPMSNNGKHLYIKSGEVVGLVQAIEGALLEAFLLFLNNGVQCSYFLINRLCLSISESINNNDPVLTDILVEMMISYISIGGSLDLNQFNIIRNADDNLASNLEKLYNQPLWKKICSGNVNIELPNSLKKLAFSLGLNPSDDKTTLCSEFDRITMADFDTLRENAISRQRQRISNSTSTISGLKTFSGCTNGQQSNIIPEEYNDANLFYYRDGDNIFCYTSEMYETIISTKKDPITKKKLDSSTLNSLSCKLKQLQDMGLDPLEPLSISQAILQLNQEDVINSKETNFYSQSIKQIIMAQNYELFNINKINTNDLNKILQSIKMEQQLLPKLTPQHQLDTFYIAIYYALQINTELSKVFLKTYKTVLTNEKITILKSGTPITKREEKIILIEEVGVPNTNNNKEIVVQAPKQFVTQQVVTPQQFSTSPQIINVDNEIVVSPVKKYVLQPISKSPEVIVTTSPRQNVATPNQVVVVTAPENINNLNRQIVSAPQQQIVSAPQQQIVTAPKNYILVPKQQQVIVKPQTREQQQAAIIANQQALYRQQQQTIALQNKELQQKQEIVTKEAIAQQAARDAQQQKAYALAQQQALLQQQALAASQREQVVLAQQQAVINAQNQQLSQQQAVINQQKQKLSAPTTVTVKEVQKSAPVAVVQQPQQVRFRSVQAAQPIQVINTPPSQIITTSTNVSTNNTPDSYEYLPVQQNREFYNVDIKGDYE